MKNNVKVSQIALLLLIIIPGGKYISLPAILCSQVGRHSWLVVAILLAFDAVCLFMLLIAVRANRQQLSFGEVLDKSIGVVGSKVVLLIMAMWLALRLITLSTSVYRLFNITFNIKVNWLAYVLPLLAVMFVLVRNGFMVIARLNQLFAPIIVVAVLSIVVYPIIGVDSYNLLPLFGEGVGDVLSAIIGNGFWFADFFFIYFVLGDIKVGDRLFSPVMIAFAVGALLTVVMNGVFVALYGKLAPFTDLAMPKVSQYALNISTSGRLDWLSLSVWTISLFIKMSVLCFSLYQCVNCLFSIKWHAVSYVSYAIITLLMLVPLFVPSEQLLQVALGTLTIPIMVVQYLLAIVMPLLVRVACCRVRGNAFMGQEAIDEGK